MNRIKIRFHDDTPDQEIEGIRSIVFIKGKKAKFVHIDPSGNGLASKIWKIEQIAYIEVGNG